MRIEVTSRHIADGGRWSPRFCPVALAIGQALGVEEVEVDFRGRGLLGIWYAEIDGDTCSLPDEAGEFALAFDRLGPTGVRPFAFDLPDPRGDRSPAA